MVAVWSQWSKPMETARRHAWLTHKHALMGHALSYLTASRHYERTALYTDDFGKWMLVDGLGLKFDTVSIELNDLKNSDEQWWALGKMYAYRLQTEPFIHIDSDVFLWKRLPQHLEEAPVFTQNPEDYLGNNYNAAGLEHHLKHGPNGGWLPEEWIWYRQQPNNISYNLGIFGGYDTKFIAHYADQAIRIVEHPDNQQGMSEYQMKNWQMTLIEQYVLSACVAFHNITPANLFSSYAEAYDPKVAADLGFTHLLAQSKRTEKNSNNLETRMRYQYPDTYKRCMEIGELLEKEGVGTHHLTLQSLRDTMEHDRGTTC